MKFELLPNEILLDYFGYFNALDLFYAYDGLNYRLNKLIRILPLHLNFQYANKSKFGEFCRTMSLNEELRNQIYALHLSNQETDFQIEAFLSFLSLNQFINLRSLSITETDSIDSTKIISMLSSISKLQTLSIISSDFPFNTINETLFIKNLTIFYCFLNELYQLLQHMPLLKYLNIQCLNDDGYSYDTNRLSNTPCAIHLKELIIGDLQCTFMNFKIFVKQIPNLQILTISTRKNRDMFEANLWEHLIRISLPHLITFDFNFGCIYDCIDDCIYGCIYGYLTLQLNILIEEYSYYFSNITSLRLVPSETLGHRMLTNQHIQILKTIVNLFNLKHLNIERIYGIENTLVLLEILKQSPKLSSITFIPKAIIQLFNDDELCKYLNILIKKIILTDYFEYYANNSEKIKQFCQIFSNIEYLECKINSPDNLLLLLNYLPKLSSIKAIGNNKCYPERKFSPFENALRRLNVIFNINHVFISEFYETRISIWIGNKII
ncbi:unnamed protein product [Adineta steineri]|uniref:F-box domain-containing protein n=2 Tax=Adineta steineri TaxID=433720 RepID=A0A819SBS8_9BILA|nr:unnamed protein product [Adineta steineri]